MVQDNNDGVWDCDSCRHAARQRLRDQQKPKKPFASQKANNKRKDRTAHRGHRR